MTLSCIMRVWCPLICPKVTTRKNGQTLNSGLVFSYSLEARGRAKRQSDNVLVYRVLMLVISSLH